MHRVSGNSIEQTTAEERQRPGSLRNSPPSGSLSIDASLSRNRPERRDPKHHPESPGTRPARRADRRRRGEGLRGSLESFNGRKPRLLASLDVVLAPNRLDSHHLPACGDVQESHTDRVTTQNSRAVPVLHLHIVTPVAATERPVAARTPARVQTGAHPRAGTPHRHQRHNRTVPQRGHTADESGRVGENRPPNRPASGRSDALTRESWLRGETTPDGVSRPRTARPAGCRWSGSRRNRARRS